MKTQPANLKPLTWGDVFEEAAQPVIPLTPAEFCAALFNNLRDAHHVSPITWEETFERCTALTAA